MYLKIALTLHVILIQPCKLLNDSQKKPKNNFIVVLKLDEWMCRSYSFLKSQVTKCFIFTPQRTKPLSKSGSIDSEFSVRPKENTC